MLTWATSCLNTWWKWDIRAVWARQQVSDHFGKYEVFDLFSCLNCSWKTLLSKIQQNKCSSCVVPSHRRRQALFPGGGRPSSAAVPHHHVTHPPGRLSFFSAKENFSRRFPRLRRWPFSNSPYFWHVSTRHSIAQPWAHCTLVSCFYWF